jgi:uncharacterized protein YndB with AHSA1/START domain
MTPSPAPEPRNRAALPILLPVLFVALAAGGGRAGERRLDKEITVAATLEEVWHSWTTEEGIASLLSSDSEIELEPGGAYEIYMGMKEPDESGLRGSEGCKLLSFIPKEMISFEWSFPPAVMSLRKARAKTWVVLRFDEVEGGVRVRFSQLGWRAGEDWDAGYAYFDRAWSWVLGNLKQTLEKRADRPAAEPRPEPEIRTVGSVTVKAWTDPPRRQEFEVTIPAPPARVWRAIATTEGLRETVAPGADVELRPGGRYAIWPGATNRVLTLVPGEMLSTSGSAPEKFPEVRKGGTWSAFFLEPAGDVSTRLRLAVVGWREGGEWDEAFDYFLANNAFFLDSLRDRLAGGPGPGRDE